MDSGSFVDKRKQRTPSTVLGTWFGHYIDKLQRNTKVDIHPPTPQFHALDHELSCKLQFSYCMKNTVTRTVMEFITVGSITIMGYFVMLV